MSYIGAHECVLARCKYEYPCADHSDTSATVLYDVIERQRLEARIVDAIRGLVKRCPPESHGYLTLPIVRRAGRSRLPMKVILRTTESGWFVTADRFYTKYDTRWLAKLDMSELRTCLRFFDHDRRSLLRISGQKHDLTDRLLVL
jgi:hypothetical protein